MKTRTLTTLLVLLSLAASPVLAELKLPAVISEGMVLQRGKEVTLWGWADKGATVRVALAGKSAQAKAGDDGRWSLKLGKLNAGGPFELQVQTSTGDNAVVKDVLVGEVWVCSGQSNMQWPLTASENGAKHAEEANHPKIRLFNVPRQGAKEPQQDVTAQWQPVSPHTAGAFSAVGYFFGRALHQELDVPIGLIGTNYGGTPAEAWTSRGSLEAQPSLKPLLDRWDKVVADFDPAAAQADYEKQMAAWKEASDKAIADNQPRPRQPVAPTHPSLSPHCPASLYNAMIAPIADFTVAGAIWYQGESNVTRAYQYRTLFPTMIEDWRQSFGDPKLPFYFVQLAPYRYGGQNPGACAELWEAQLMTLKNVPHTGMVVTTDIGNTKDIHPANKLDVGLRLARVALAETYGRKDLVYSGPIYKSMKINGSKAVLSFDHVGGGLVSRDGNALSRFTIAGEDQQFHPAEAQVVKETVIVTSAAVEKPVAVRFAWDDTAEPNLMNKEGLPASPFRTDAFKGVTEGVD